MKVLIADDEAISRRLLQGYLERWGHEVVAAQNGAEAWELFAAGDFPVVISDWVMPELDGVELIRRIRASQRPGYVYTILLTSKAQKEDLVEGMEAGADDFVTKPFDRDELRVRLRAGERIIQLEQNLAEQNRALREAQAALIQSEKLASLGQLAAGMAHEINNPIAYVTNNVAVLRRDVLAAMDVLNTYRAGRESLARVEPQLAADAARMEGEIDLAYIQENLARQFEKSLEGLQRVRDIVKNLRDFARLDEAEFKEVDLNAAIASTVEIIRYEMKKKEIQLETRFQELPPVLCHPGKINQVFLNLLINAVQACESGGVIKVRTRPEPQGAVPGESVVIEIEDNGCGISPEHLPRLFDPFFTTKPVGQGTGLGLSVSYGIIRDHGGTIEVESEAGRGSHLPRTASPATASGMTQGSCRTTAHRDVVYRFDRQGGKPMAQSTKHSILVVDDEPEILYSLRGLLRMEFEVHTAESGREAIRILQQQPVHVVMSDQRMPEMTGVELLSQVQGEYPDAIRMVFTGYADIKAVIDAINQGHIFRYITKPWDPDELRAVLHQACEEYDRIVERKRLLTDLRDYQARCLTLVEKLRGGQFGPLNPAGQADTQQVAEVGSTLLNRLERVLTSAQHQATAGRQSEQS